MFHKTLNTSRITAVCLFAGLAVSGISAQSSRRDEALDSLISRHQIIYADGSKGSVYDPEVRSMIEEFYVDQFENTRQPQAPYFLFMSRDNNFAMGVGGDVRLRAYFDPGNSLPSSSLHLSTSPSHAMISTAITSPHHPQVRHSTSASSAEIRNSAGILCISRRNSTEAQARISSSTRHTPPSMTGPSVMRPRHSPTATPSLLQ